MELEALEAILMDDLQVFDGTNPDGWKAVGETYKVVIDGREDGDGDEDSAEKLMELLFAHTERYPDEAPCARLRAVRGLSDADIRQANEFLEQQIQENLGMAMVFTLVQAAKDWLIGGCPKRTAHASCMHARRLPGRSCAHPLAGLG